MNIDPSVRGLLLGIMRKFPDAAKPMINCAKHRRSVEYSTTAMMEEFSNVTSDAIRRRNEDVARAHLEYISHLLDHADDKVKEYIDVYYVEVLMYDLDDESKRVGWRLIPDNLKELYIGFWGQPKFL
jgi:hypothetical protein